MDTVGALLGPALALVLMWATGNVRLVFWLAIVPALIAVLVLAIYVREPEATAPPKARVALTHEALRALGSPFWGVVALGAVLTLARVSEAFLILKAGSVGLEIALAPLVLMLFNLVYAGSAWPVGVLSDRIGQRGLLALGFGVLVLADLILAFAGGLAGVMLGVALWGLHMGMTQGLLAAAVARHAPAQMRATAFGAFNLVTGFALLLGNGLAGALWSFSGPEAAFLAGAGFAALGLIGFMRRT
jgi:MFS family permease